MNEIEYKKFKDGFYKWKQQQYKEHPLKALFFEVTLRCNARCEHCGSSCGDFVPKDEVTVDEMKKVDEKNEDFYFDTFNEKSYVLADILTFMCPNLKKKLLAMAKNDSPKIKDINNLMVRLDDQNYTEWNKIEDHIHLEELNGILM